MLDKYTHKKKKNQVVAVYTDKHMSGKMQRRICECGDWMKWIADREMVKMKLHKSNLCKNRFCPICAWIQAKKDAIKIGVIMDYIECEHGKEFIFVTLTAPNVGGVVLPQEVTKYNRSFKKLVERDIVTRMNHGYIRKLEITYNKVWDDYHVHFHCVFAVNKSYFSDRTYISQQKWLDMWRDVMDDESITQVDVRKVKRGGSTKDVREIAKYAAKDSEYTISQEVFDCFYGALKGRQLITYNGLFKESNKKYKDKELEEYKKLDCTEYYYMLLYRWGKGEYIEMERRELTEEEKILIIKQLLGETDDD